MYDEIHICLCSHMRPVVFTNAYGGEIGWYHVTNHGVVENGSHPCEADIFRFKVDRPENSHGVVHALSERDQHVGFYDPDTLTLEEEREENGK